LASAYVLKNHPETLSKPVRDKIVFHTLSGELIVDISSDEGVVLMDFPADPPGAFDSSAFIEQVADAIGTVKEDIVEVQVSPGLGYAVIEVSQSVDIASLTVNSSELVCHDLMLMIGSIVSRSFRTDYYYIV
jgi:predicted PhzF superfamily epimerase YddE/YHI9